MCLFSLKVTKNTIWKALMPSIRSRPEGPKYGEKNLRGQKSLGPLKMSLEMAQKVIVPQKKIMSRKFLNSGTLIVRKALKNISAYTESTDHNV